jgi:hypothetical protein
MSITTHKRLQSFISGNFFKRHLAHIPLDTIGVWEVIGEGDDRGYNGTKIGLFSGMLEDVIYMAIAHPDFWSWGSGGEIVLREVTVIAHDPELKAQRIRAAEEADNQKLITERTALLAQVAALDEQIAK